MHRISLAALLLFVVAPLRAEEPVSRIAFGSCLRQDKPQPIWNAVIASKPEMFLFIGDNIYGDLEQRPVVDMAILEKCWAQLGADPGYAKLKATCPILATWDDHDYGVNDGGAEYVKKRESQRVFLDFFDEPADSPRRKRKGIYDAKTFGPVGKRIQVILLDTRYFRSALKPRGRDADRSLGTDGPYGETDDPKATILGEAQWTWLERQLREPAELRIIASSIQVVPNRHRWEKWGNFPAERERLFELVKSTRANGVVFISGDRHSAEISAIKVGYPLHDVTSSSLNTPSVWHNELNEHRLGSKYIGENFGTIDVDWTEPNPGVHLRIRDIEGKSVIHVQTTLAALHRSITR